MDENRRQFIAGMAALAGAAALDGFGLLKVSLASQSASNTTSRPSRDINDYPHIIDAIPSRDMKLYFPIIVDACSDPKENYLAEMPFLIELEVAKIDGANGQRFRPNRRKKPGASKAELSYI